MYISVGVRFEELTKKRQMKKKCNGHWVSWNVKFYCCLWISCIYFIPMFLHKYLPLFWQRDAEVWRLICLLLSKHSFHLHVKAYCVHLYSTYRNHLPTSISIICPTLASCFHSHIWPHIVSRNICSIFFRSKLKKEKNNNKLFTPYRFQYSQFHRNVRTQKIYDVRVNNAIKHSLPHTYIVVLHGTHIAMHNIAYNFYTWTKKETAFSHTQ